MSYLEGPALFFSYCFVKFQQPFFYRFDVLAQEHYLQGRDCILARMDHCMSLSLCPVRGFFVCDINLDEGLVACELVVVQVGDAYIAGMAQPYLTDQHSAVRVVEFGLAMIKA